MQQRARKIVSFIRRDHYWSLDHREVLSMGLLLDQLWFRLRLFASTTASCKHTIPPDYSVSVPLAVSSFLTAQLLAQEFSSPQLGYLSSSTGTKWREVKHQRFRSNCHMYCTYTTYIYQLWKSCPVQICLYIPRLHVHTWHLLGTV